MSSYLFKSYFKVVFCNLPFQSYLCLITCFKLPCVMLPFKVMLKTLAFSIYPLLCRVVQLPFLSNLPNAFCLSYCFKLSRLSYLFKFTCCSHLFKLPSKVTISGFVRLPLNVNCLICLFWVTSYFCNSPFPNYMFKLPFKGTCVINIVGVALLNSVVQLAF